MGSSRYERLGRLAAKQHGAFSRAQAKDLGFSDQEIKRRIDCGEWIRLVAGVYAIAGSVDSWERRAMVAVLVAGIGAAVSHLAAAYVLDLSDRPPTKIDILVPYHRRARGARRAKNFTRADVKLHGEIPVTCVFRTIVDVAAVASKEGLEDILDRALVSGKATIGAIRRYVRSRGLANARGMTTLRALLDDRERGIPESELERIFERVLKKHKVPLPDRQYEVGNRRIDFIYEKQKVVIELDGRRDRSSKQRFDDDRARRNEISLALPDHLPLQHLGTPEGTGSVGR